MRCEERKGGVEDNVILKWLYFHGVAASKLGLEDSRVWIVRNVWKRFPREIYWLSTEKGWDSEQLAGGGSVLFLENFKQRNKTAVTRLEAVLCAENSVLTENSAFGV